MNDHRCTGYIFEERLWYANQVYTSTLVKSTLGPTIGKPSLSIARVVTELKFSVKPISDGLISLSINLVI